MLILSGTSLANTAMTSKYYVRVLVIKPIVKKNVDVF